jgi:hypothetical protein
MWTSYYISKKYGAAVMGELQEYLNGLDKNKKYFTVIQYDDGILQNIDDLDIQIFGAGGGGKKTVSEKNLGYPIALLCSRSPVINKSRPKGYLFSFVGSIKNHSVRRKLLDLYGDKFIVKSSTTYENFIDIMERSIFSLCPRGYGATSFRICEALQHGSVPVYIYDKPWIPWKDEFDFNEIGILVHESEITNLFNILKFKTDEEIANYVKRGAEIYEEYFTFEGATKQIIKKING